MTCGIDAKALSAASTLSRSTPSMSRRNTSRAAVRSTMTMATVMSRPTTGSAQFQPTATPLRHP